MKKLRIGRGTVITYVVACALLPLIIYGLLSLQARSNHHPRSTPSAGPSRLRPGEPGRAQQAGQAGQAPAAAGSAAAGHAPAATRPGQPGAWGDGRTAAGPPDDTDPPATGSLYNWTFMGYSAVLMLVMLGFLLWIIRKNTRSRT